MRQRGYTKPTVDKILTIFFEFCKYHDGKIHKNGPIVLLSATAFPQMPLLASIC